MATPPEPGYERPLVEPDSRMLGGFQTGRYDASPNVTTGRAAARWSVALAVIWLFGLASLVAVGAAILALASGEIDPRHRRLAWIGLVLGAVGFIAGMALAATSV